MAHGLIIDDSRLARKICRILFEKFGHSVAEAEDGMQGLALSARTHFDFFVVDQNMPELKGLDVIRTLRTRPSVEQTPIILCSCDATALLMRNARRAGANAYLNKPFNAGALARRLKRLHIV